MINLLPDLGGAVKSSGPTHYSMGQLEDYVAAGVLQRLLEWLPVSSEGNLALIIHATLGIQAEPLALAIVLHLGTSISALLYLRKDLTALLQDAAQRGLLAKLAAATILSGLVGALVYTWLHTSLQVGESLLALTGGALILSGLLQRAALREEAGSRELDWIDVVALGLAQGLSVIPGLSRSGTTTSLLLIRGHQPQEALKTSFLLSIPLGIAAATGLALLGHHTPTPLSLVAALSALASGYLSIGFMLRLAGRLPFWAVCLALGSSMVLSATPSLVA